nr:transcriptional repressor LexA [Desulfobulbaceae bacterium]
MNRELTPRQKSVIGFIRTHQEKYGISPSVREICCHLGLKGPAGIHKILHQLIEKGALLKGNPGKNRSWLLADGPARKSIPLYGCIAAGAPIEAVGDQDEDLPLDPALFGCDECFALTVRGDSMIEANIIDGDLAIIRPQTTVNSGQIVAVQIEGLLHEATLKIFRRKKDHIELHAANPAYPPLIFPKEEMARVKIVGKYVGIIRR